MKLRIGVAVLLLLPSTAFAQGNPGPFGGLFGRTPEREGGEFTALELRNSYAGQYDDAILLEDSLPDDDLPRSGYTGGVNLGLGFDRQTSRTTFKTQAGATYQEFYRSPTFGATSYNAGMLARARVTTRFDVEAQGQYVRSPFFRLVPDPSAASGVVVPGDPFAIRLLDSESRSVSGGFVSRYSKQSTLTVTATQRATRFLNDANLKFDVLGAQAIWRRQLTRSFALHAGYGQERINQSTRPDADYVYELIDLGIDFTRPISLTRRTTLGITTQTTAVKRPLTGRRYRVNGNATVTSYYARTWRVAAGVSRNTEFLPGFVEPLFSDSVNATLAGLMTPRSELLLTLTGGKGRLGVDGEGRYTTAHSNARINFAITRHIGVYGQYAVYYYKLPPNALGVVLPSQVSRQSISLGINTWLPLLNKVRAPRDPE